MRIQIKFLIVLSITFVLAIITLFIIYNITVGEQLVLKKSLSFELKQNIKTLIDHNTESLREQVNDYTYWDEMVRFVENNDENWAYENLESMLHGYSINAVWVFDTLQNNIYHTSNSENLFTDTLVSDDLFLKTLHKQRYIHNFKIVNNSTLIEIEGATIHPTNDAEHKTIPRGYFLVARVWDANELQTMERITSTKIEIIRAKLNPETPSNDNTICTFVPINNWLNNTVCYLQIEKRLEYLSILQNTSFKILLVFILTTMLFLAILTIASTFGVFKPLQLIETILIQKDSSKIRQLKSYGNEFRRVGLLIQNIFNKTEQLKIAKEKSESANKFINTFLYNINHEIRTPMNSILGFSRLLIEHFPDNIEPKLQYAGFIEESCSTLLNIINDIIDMAQIESGEMKISKTCFSATKSINELIPGYIQQVKDKNKNQICITTNIQTAIPEYFINTDKYLFIKLIDILMGNAIKFTNIGHIEIGINPPLNNEIVFYVKDTGIGIPPEKLNIIFNNFQQANESTPVYYGGTGMGLAICKGVLKALGGKIWVHSDVNKGSEFFFSLPYIEVKIPHICLT